MESRTTTLEATQLVATHEVGSPLTPNPGKELLRVVRGRRVARYPVRTSVVTERDDLRALVRTHVHAHLRAGDMLVVSERIVAITQGRAYPISEIHPSFLARGLARWVFKPSWGIGIGSPWTMELALREAGVARVLFAAAVSALTKPLGVRGMFYRVVGHRIAAIDGPTSYTLPPYNTYAKLPPEDPEGVARVLSADLGVPVAIIDANDIGVSVLGATPEIDRTFLSAVFRDNPLGQTNEQTPVCIVREIL